MQRKGRSVKKTFIIILISLSIGCVSIPVRNDKIIPEKDNILKGSYLIMTNGWHKVEDERYVYIVDELIIAELWSDYTGWFWVVYIKKDLKVKEGYFNPYIHGFQLNYEDALKEVNDMMFGAYWM